MSDEHERLGHMMRASFEADLPLRLERASRVKLQPIIPNHWFSSAASECASMYISGLFYGSISVAQAYVEALSKFLCETDCVRCPNDVKHRWKRLTKEAIVSHTAAQAALDVLDKRNDFHHLNKDIEQDFAKLEVRAENCVNHIYAIESEVFAYSFDEPGKITPHNPKYWPPSGPGLVRINARQCW